jgi:hypothetical protein
MTNVLVVRDISKARDPGVVYAIRLASAGKWFRLRSMSCKLSVSTATAKRKLQYAARVVLANVELVSREVTVGSRTHTEYQFKLKEGGGTNGTHGKKRTAQH